MLKHQTQMVLPRYPEIDYIIVHDDPSGLRHLAPTMAIPRVAGKVRNLEIATYRRSKQRHLGFYLAYRVRMRGSCPTFCDSQYAPPSTYSLIEKCAYLEETVLQGKEPSFIEPCSTFRYKSWIPGARGLSAPYSSIKCCKNGRRASVR